MIPNHNHNTSSFRLVEPKQYRGMQTVRSSCTHHQQEHQPQLSLIYKTSTATTHQQISQMDTCGTYQHQFVSHRTRNFSDTDSSYHPGWLTFSIS